MQEMVEMPDVPFEITTESSNTPALKNFYTKKHRCSLAAAAQLTGILFSIGGIVTASISGGATLPLAIGIINSLVGLSVTGIGVANDIHALKKLFCGTSPAEDRKYENELIEDAAKRKHQSDLDILNDISENTNLLNNERYKEIFKLICKNQTLRNSSTKIDLEIQNSIIAIINKMQNSQELLNSIELPQNILFENRFKKLENVQQNT